MFVLIFETPTGKQFDGAKYYYFTNHSFIILKEQQCSNIFHPKKSLLQDLHAEFQQIEQIECFECHWKEEIRSY